jgi:hypothetical protein
LSGSCVPPDWEDYGNVAAGQRCPPLSAKTEGLWVIMGPYKEKLMVLSGTCSRCPPL